MISSRKVHPYVLVALLLLVVISWVIRDQLQPDNEEDLFTGSEQLFTGSHVQIQGDNPYPQYKLVPQDPEVTDIRLGAGAYSSFTQNDLPGLNHSVRTAVDFGIQRLDTSVGEVEEPIFWDYRWEEAFPQEYADYVSGLYDNGVAVNYILHYWNKAGHANDEELETPRFQSEQQINDFLNYTRYVVSHFGELVPYYTVWSEPDNCGGGGIKCIRTADYINLIKLIAPVIREGNPQAKISIAPNVLYFAQDYLFDLLVSDIMEIVDVIQWHGIYNVLPNDYFYRNYYYQYPSLVERIRNVAITNGFEGEFWATEISYCSEEFPHCVGDSQTWNIPETDKQAAKYTARSVIQHMGMDVGVGLMTWLQDIPDWAPWTLPTISNLYKLLAGSLPLNLTHTFEDAPDRLLAHGFHMPTDDPIFSYWDHNTAVDDDDGVLTTLIFPEMEAHQVIAIDILHGFEQQLVIETKRGDLMIQNLEVKDYPILLRLISTPSSDPSPHLQGSGLFMMTTYQSSTDPMVFSKMINPI